MVDEVARERRVERPGEDEAEQALAVADRRVGSRLEPEVGEPSSVGAILGPGAPRLSPGALRSVLVQVGGAGGGQRPPGCHGQALGSSHREGEATARVLEGEDRRDIDPRHPGQFVADRGRGLLGALARLEVGQGQGDGGPLAELGGEGRACGCERRHVALDPQVAVDLAIRTADRRDRGVDLVELAVLAPIAEPAGPGFTARQPAPHRPIEGLRLAAALGDPRVLADRLVGPVAGELREGGVHVLDRPGEVGHDDRVGALLDRRAEPDALALGGPVGADVVDHPDQVRTSPRGVEDGRYVDLPDPRAGRIDGNFLPVHAPPFLDGSTVVAEDEGV